MKDIDRNINSILLQKAIAAETAASNAAESATAAEKSATDAKESETAAIASAVTATEQAEKIRTSSEQIEKNKTDVASLKEDLDNQTNLVDLTALKNYLLNISSDHGVENKETSLSSGDWWAVDFNDSYNVMYIKNIQFYIKNVTSENRTGNVSFALYNSENKCVDIIENTFTVKPDEQLITFIVNKLYINSDIKYIAVNYNIPNSYSYYHSKSSNILRKISNVQKDAYWSLDTTLGGYDLSFKVNLKTYDSIEKNK